jgi:hypothetical protein
MLDGLEHLYNSVRLKGRNQDGEQPGCTLLSLDSLGCQVPGLKLTQKFP